MKYRVQVETRVYDYLRKLSSNVCRNILFKIKSLENFDMSTPNIKKLKYPMFGYRLRVGDYRVLFILDTGKNSVFVYTLDHRKDVYR